MFAFIFTFCSIDASSTDCLAKYVNDSVCGNCKMKKVKVQGVDHLCLFATKPIRTDDELRYNYADNRKDCDELFWRKVIYSTYYVINIFMLRDWNYSFAPLCIVCTILYHVHILH